MHFHISFSLVSAGYPKPVPMTNGCPKTFPISSLLSSLHTLMSLCECLSILYRIYPLVNHFLQSPLNILPETNNIHVCRSLICLYCLSFSSRTCIHVHVSGFGFAVTVVVSSSCFWVSSMPKYPSIILVLPVFTLFAFSSLMFLLVHDNLNLSLERAYSVLQPCSQHWHSLIFIDCNTRQ